MTDVGLIGSFADGGYVDGIVEEVGRQLGQNTVRLFSTKSTREGILSKIQKTKLFSKTWDCSIFFTFYMKFTHPYTLEEINKQLVESLKEYKMDKQKDCSYKINNVCCHVLPEYSFVGNPSINDFDEDYSLDFYPKSFEHEIIIPEVDSITIYVAPMTSRKIDYYTYLRIFRKIEDKMKETNHHIRRTGSFLYFKFDDHKNLEKMYVHLQKEIKKQKFDLYLDKIGQDELRLLNIVEVKDLIATLI